ncbi:TrkH family potassium uptake protein [Salinisphaera sp. P385]|uniref:Trk system potassium uptake protein n=1 Tax=Spectribacter acetivorans TaxID=3075603 RepID=A0ABU3BA33_9GAMM|nr:TrkH family potassium uptake protein [Salinisphaera sp. P385]MDT0618890.1 TrkH family potassium uptake protein [Salinisphaera sp. P385]
MNHSLAVAQRLVGILLMLFSTTMLIPAAVSLLYRDGEADTFFISFCVTLAAGIVSWLPVRAVRRELKLRDGFLVVVLFWMVLSLFGAIPLHLSNAPALSITDAVYESVSGLTTTGATVIVGLDRLPQGILLWRQLLQWLGGMGVIVLAVAVLPMLGVGGMQLYRAETPGPIKDSKLTPRIRETARALWMIYVGLTVLCALCFWLAGMTAFDAIGHAFSTLSTAGFSTHDASMGYFDSALIEGIAVVFMFIGAVNFALHFLAWRSASVMAYLRDPEFRGWALLAAGVTIACTLALMAAGTYSEPGIALIKSAFQVVSIGTTTGYTTADFTLWPSFIPMMLILGSIVGGCGGSTTSGIKVARFMLLIKQGVRELNRQVHPSAEMPVKLGGRVIPDPVIQAVWGYFSIYMGVYAVVFMILMAIGLDEITAFSAVAACLNNLGPGLGEVSSNMAGVPDIGKWVLSLAMLMGRLEILTLLVILTPAFWRR